MFRIICILLLICANNCFSQSGKSAGDRLELDGMITLHIRYNQVLAGTRVKLGTYHSFPQSDLTVKTDTLAAGKRNCWIRSAVRSVGTSFLTLGDSTLTVLVIPGDTIGIDLSVLGNGTSKSLQISFTGRTKKIQEYYAAKRRKFADPLQECMNTGMAAENLKPFKKMIDGSYQKMDAFWTDYKEAHQLPAWFVEYETNSIRYSDAWLRLYMVWYQIKYQKKTQTVLPDYYTFLNRIVVKNEKAMFQYDYNRFLREYMGWKMMSLKEKPLDYFSFTRKELGKNLAELFEIWELSGSKDNPNWVESQIREGYSPQNQYLVDYVKERSQTKRKLLSPGDKAPGFALVDSRDSLISLSRFKGEVVYLSFWFTTCGGCIAEFPYENALVEKFRDKPVRIISICTYTPGVPENQQIAKWLAASNRFKLKTINLFANKSWREALKEKYIVSSYPHYVLIGKDGNIIENFASRPSQGIAEKIEKALEIEN